MLRVDRRIHAAGRAFSLVELMLIVAIVALLVALLMPALRHSREAARRAQCQSQLRQLGMITQSYSTDEKAAVMIAEPRFWIHQMPLTPYAGPTTDIYYNRYWVSYLYDLRYFRALDLAYCPSDQLGRNAPVWQWNTARILGNWIYDLNTAANCSYGINYLGFGKRYLPTYVGDMTTPINGKFWKTHQVKRPARTFYLGDNADSTADTWSGFGLFPDLADDNIDITTRHGPAMNLFWMDGHVEAQPYREYQIRHYYGAYFLGSPQPETWFNPVQ